MAQKTVNLKKSDYFHKSFTQSLLNALWIIPAKTQVNEKHKFQRFYHTFCSVHHIKQQALTWQALTFVLWPSIKEREGSLVCHLISGTLTSYNICQD